MKKKVTKAKKWHYLKGDYPKPSKWTLGPSTTDIIVIDKKGYEISAHFVDFSVPGFFGSDHKAMNVIAWRYKLNSD